MKRGYLKLRHKLASALYEVQYLRWRLDPRKQQPFGWRQRDSAVQVESRFDWHHEVPHAEGGSDEWPNLTPMLRAEHREQTRGDIARIAKNKRVQRKHEAHRAKLKQPSFEERLQAQADETAAAAWNYFNSGKSWTGRRPLKRRWPSRPFPKRHKK